MCSASQMPGWQPASLRTPPPFRSRIPRRESSMIISAEKMLCAVAVLAGTMTLAQGQANDQIVTENGVTYRVTSETYNQLVPTTEIQTRQSTVLQPQTVTQMQTYQQTYVTPVTEYRWVARRRGVLNPFVQPYWTHQLEPFTRWEARPATVQVPTTQTTWVPVQQTTQVPVVTYKAMPQEVIRRVAIATPATATPNTAIASSPIGGQRMEGDPPRTANAWQSGAAPATGGSL